MLSVAGQETMTEVPVVFTPDNEPFLGRPSVYRFDLVISLALEDNAKVAALHEGA